MIVKFMLLICILQQYCYKFKLTFLQQLEYNYVIFLSACMGNISVWLTKQHVDCNDNCRLLNAFCTSMSRSKVAIPNVCMI